MSDPLLLFVVGGVGFAAGLVVAAWRLAAETGEVWAEGFAMGQASVLERDAERGAWLELEEAERNKVENKA